MLNFRTACGPLPLSYIQDYNSADTNMPESDEYEPRTVLQNLRLIATRRTFTIFVVTPPVFWLLFWYNIGTKWGDATITTIAIWLIMVVAGAWLMHLEGLRIKKELEREGYVQWWERGQLRQIDFILNLVILQTFVYWMQRTPEEVEADRAQGKPEPTGARLHARIGFRCATITLFIEYAILGPILWFTVRRRIQRNVQDRRPALEQGEGQQPRDVLL